MISDNSDNILDDCVNIGLSIYEARKVHLRICCMTYA